ncbi:MAG TPA: hypothetical protein H9695_13285 [Candidatus Mediterraneibacter excrementigallinarum]|nr:hypothetical protein [Candidatus Mediterraneibacter excrementigallinarum]
MRKRKRWNICLNELFYCNPKLNRRLLCMRDSMNEVCDILNKGFCCGDGRKNRKCR